MMQRAMRPTLMAFPVLLAFAGCGDDAEGSGEVDGGTPVVDLGRSDLGGTGDMGSGPSPFGENANQTCADGIDNDEDGFLDCDDRGCEDRWVCAFEANNVDCADGMDNDGDGFTDCDDDQCQGDGIVVCDGPGVAATPADISAAIAARCSDGMANVNTFVDCFDFSCQHFHEPCFEAPEIVRESSNALCSDGLDTDGDGAVDCADSDCGGEAIVVCDGEGNPVDLTPEEIAAQANERCMNGISDDDNDFVDCEDFSCSQNEPLVTVCPDPPEGTDEACMDGEDNDMDGFVDCDDFDCSMSDEVTVCDSPEGTDEACMDGEDNDMDGFVDCEDFDCSMNDDVTVCADATESTDRACSNAQDDDGNGFIDCDDNSCPDDGPACRGVDPDAT
ncbi:MAG: hypothetical protein AAGH15_24060 [Myxococcota bacterium]